MRPVIDRIESLIQRDVGRGMAPVFAATRGGLYNAASALAEAPAPRIGLITGFFVPAGDPPAAETDGPGGAALMARGFSAAGLHCRLATDTLCGSACRAGLRAAGADIPVDTVAPGAGTEDITAIWRENGIDWVIAIERCGPSADGRPRNMRATDISTYTAPLDRLFLAGPWRTIAIGDGGNEIGMGSLPPGLLSRHVPLGDQIGCVTPADHLVTAGVSHWGAYAILSALGMLRPEWNSAMRAALDPDLDRAVVAAMVRDGPAVDGITLRRAMTIDALDASTHASVLEDIRGLTAG